MDNTLLKLAFAGLIHDIGFLVDKDVFNITGQCIENHKSFEEGDTKALYTATFIKQMKQWLPNEFDSEELAELAAGYQTPNTPMQWIVKVSDCVSNGTECDISDNSKHLDINDYKNFRLLPLFEQLSFAEENKEKDIDKLSYCYPLKKVSPTNIFPGLRDEILPKSTEEAKEQYKELFKEFIGKLQILKHKDQNLKLWIEHFESLMMIYTSCIPAVSSQNIIPDVSFFDHSKVTSAVAIAIYLYHKQCGTLEEDKIKNYNDNKFLIINGNFQGIQKYIFKGYGDSGKYRSKILRGRSFAVSLLSELAAHMLCSKIGLPSTSVILNAAGRFTVLSHNTKEAMELTKETEKIINEWLVKVAYGETIINLSFQEAACKDFIPFNFVKLRNRMQNAMEIKKFSSNLLEIHGGAAKGFLTSFDKKEFNPSLCPICHKRPSSVKAKKADDQDSCKICIDHIFLGTNLVINDSTKDRLLEPLFGKYQIEFEGKNRNKKLKVISSEGKLIKYWDLGISPEENVAVKFINGYIPVYKKDDIKDEDLEEKKPGMPITFNDIAGKAKISSPNEDDKFRGIEALGVLKADVDNLGILMGSGINEKRFTFTRLTTLSRQLNYFFSVYLPYLFTTEDQFENIYTVFAGGDDLFLIGPWNSIIELARYLRDKFDDYVRNENVHFSAGISLHKAHTPIDAMAARVEKEIEKSKTEGRNRLTLFSETVEWKQVYDLYLIKSRLEEWLDTNTINKAMLFRLNLLMEMVAEEERIIKQSLIDINDMSCTKWRSMLAYTLIRNAAKETKDNEEGRREEIDEVRASLADWLLKYKGKLKIPVWDILYNSR